MDANKPLPLDLLEDVKSSLECLCLEASERGEMGDRSNFSFLFMGIAKLKRKITVMECHRASTGGGKRFIYDPNLLFNTCWEEDIYRELLYQETILWHQDHNKQ